MKFWFWFAILMGGWCLCSAALRVEHGELGWALLMLFCVWLNFRSAIRMGRVLALQNGKEVK